MEKGGICVYLWITWVDGVKNHRRHIPDIFFHVHIYQMKSSRAQFGISFLLSLLILYIDILFFFWVLFNVVFYLLRAYERKG
jgi:hypothetical protein